jgi:hypothetical protein
MSPLVALLDVSVATADISGMPDGSFSAADALTPVIPTVATRPATPSHTPKRLKTMPSLLPVLGGFGVNVGLTPGTTTDQSI